ncbi:MAG: ATP-binding protein [Selenomonadaceae bacterium]|nr:ATP-binding protein [Selenomonadaceae bacterium]
MAEINQNLNAEVKMVKRLFFSMAISQIATACCIMLSGVANGIFIGKFLGAQDMAAFGLINPVYLLMSAISTTFAVGVSTYCGILLGKGNIQKAREVFTTNAVTIIFLSITFTGLVIFFSDNLCEMMGARGIHENLKPGLISYLYGFSPAFLAMALSLNLMTLLYLEGAKKRILIAMISSLIVNIIGDFLNVYVFNGGLFGMAAATTFSYYVTFVILALHYRKGSLLFFTRQNFSLKPLSEIFTLGFSNVISRLSVFGRIFAINYLLVSGFSQVALTAFSVKSNLDNLLISVVIGISSTILTMGAVYGGEEDKMSMHILYKLSLKYGLLLTIFVSVAVFLFAEQIAGLYLSENPEAGSETVMALRLYIISLPLYLIGESYTSFARVLKKKFLSSVICGLENFGFVIFFAYVLGYSVGLNGVWLSFFCGEVATMIFIFIAICKHCGHFPKSLDDVMMLPSDFDLSSKERLRLTVTNMPEVLKASENVQKFLLKQGVSERDAYIMALSVEELGGNIIRWSFKSAKKNTISIYLVFKDNEWILRLRDDCEPFNPKKWLELSRQNKEYPFKNIGIRLIMSMAKNVEYLNVLRINNLIIRIPQN